MIFKVPSNSSLAVILLFLSAEKYCLFRTVFWRSSPPESVHFSQLGVQSFLVICKHDLCMVCTTTLGCTLSASCQNFQALFSTSAFLSFDALAAAVFSLVTLPAYLVTILDPLGKCKQSVTPGLQSELCGWPSVDPHWPQISQDWSFSSNLYINKNPDIFHYSFI